MKPSNLIIKANLKIFFTSLFLFLFFTFSSTSATTSSNEKPADYVNLHDTYTRAPEDKEYYSFNTSAEAMHGYFPYFRVFVPPGTVLLDSNILEGKVWEINAVARHNKTPLADPISGSGGDYYKLSDLETNDCFVKFNANMDCLYIARDGFSPPLEKNRAGWLYVKVGGGEGADPLYLDNHFTVRVDTKTYNTWWDKYIKNEAGWKKYIESVETYIDPSV